MATFLDFSKNSQNLMLSIRIQCSEPTVWDGDKFVLPIVGYRIDKLNSIVPSPPCGMGDFIILKACPKFLFYTSALVPSPPCGMAT
jgi:hypothetical protein